MSFSGVTEFHCNGLCTIYCFSGYQQLGYSSEAGVHVVTARGEFLTELTLTVLEAKGRNLVRCHKQFLVNLAQIDEINRQDPTAAFIRTRSGRTVPVSRRFLAPLKEKLGI